MKIALTALKKFSYAGHRIRKGDVFKAVSADARLLVAIGSAAVVPPVAPLPAARSVRRAAVAAAPERAAVVAATPVPPNWPPVAAGPSPWDVAGVESVTPAVADGDLEALRAEYLAVTGTPADKRIKSTRLAWEIARLKAQK